MDIKKLLKRSKSRRIIAFFLAVVVTLGNLYIMQIPALATDFGYGVTCEYCKQKVDRFTSQYERSSSSDEDGGWDEHTHVSVKCATCNKIVFTLYNCDGQSSDGYSSGTDAIRSSSDLPSQDPVYRKDMEYLSAMISQLYELQNKTFSWSEWLNHGVSTSVTYANYGIAAYLTYRGYSYQIYNEYTVTYNANGGTGTMSNQVISASGGILNANTFAREGYSFAGWSTSAGGGVNYGDKASFAPTEDTILYAIWNPNNYDITCIDIDSTHNIELGRTSVKKAFGSSVKGTDFGGDQNSGVYYAGYKFTVGTSATVTIDVKNNIVYRYFAPQSCSVTLVDMVYGEDTVLGTDNTLSKLCGDSVRGSDYGTTSPYEGFTFNSDTSAIVQVSGTTIYRYFSRNNYTVSYVDVVSGDGGKEIGRQNVDKGYGIEVSGAEMGTDNTVGAYYPGYYYSGNSSTAVVTINGATVYRYFSPSSYDITYISVVNDISGKELGRDLQAGAGVFDTEVSGDAIGTDTNAGAYFDGYSYFAASSAFVTVDGAVVYRFFKPVEYPLNLELNGGSIDSVIDKYIFGQETKLPSVYRTGYSFDGWYTDPDFLGEAVAYIGEEEKGEKTFYAKWAHDTYNITMDFSGTGNEINVYRDNNLVEDDTLYYGDTIIVDFGFDPGRLPSGYDITSTVTDDQIKDYDNCITFTMPDSDVHIVTYWKECKDLKVSLNQLFYDTYQVEPYWNGTDFNIDTKPSITLTTEMLDVTASIYDTKNQQWIEEPVITSELSFEGSNTLTDINQNIFTVYTDVFKDGCIQKGNVTIKATSGSLDDVMDKSETETYKELKEYVDRLESDIKLYEQLVIDLQTKLQISNEKKEEYEGKIAELAEELIKAQKEYEDAVKSSEERIQELETLLKEKQKEYEDKVQSLTDKINEIEKALENSESLSAEEIANLIEQKKELSKELADLIASHEAEVAGMKKELEDLYSELEKHKAIINGLTEELENTKKIYETEIADLEAELNEIRNKVDELLNKIVAMEETIKELLGRDDIDIGNGSLEDLKDILDELKDQVNDLNNKIEDLIGENEDLKEDINNKEDQIAELDKIIEDLKKQEHSGGSSESSGGVSDKEYNEVKKENSQLNEEIKDLNQKLQDNSVTIQQQQTIIAALESQKESLTKEVNNLKKKLEEQEKQIAILNEKLEEKDRELILKDQEIANLKAYIAELEKKASQLITVEKETEVSLAEPDTQLVPLNLITVKSSKEENKMELLTDYPIVKEEIIANTTLNEGDISQNMNPVVIVMIVIGIVGAAGAGLYFLNRKYHFLFF